MGGGGVLKSIEDISTGGLTAGIRAGSSGGGIKDVAGAFAGSTLGAPFHVGNAVKATPSPAAPPAPRPPESPAEAAANAAAVAANKKKTDLLATETSEAKALGTSLDNVVSGVGRSGYGLDSKITSPLGLEPDALTQRRRLLGL